MESYTSGGALHVRRTGFRRGVGLTSDAEYELQAVEDSSNGFFCIVKSSSHFY